MARYRHKSEEDLRWNRIRRKLTREMDTQVMNWREESLNTLLHGAWEKYTEALNTGAALELESEYSEWVARALREQIVLELPSHEVG
jgi:hypothetical protein